MCGASLRAISPTLNGSPSTLLWPRPGSDTTIWERNWGATAKGGMRLIPRPSHTWWGLSSWSACLPAAGQPSSAPNDFPGDATAGSSVEPCRRGAGVLPISSMIRGFGKIKFWRSRRGIPPRRDIAPLLGLGIIEDFIGKR